MLCWSRFIGQIWVWINEGRMSCWHFKYNVFTLLTVCFTLIYASPLTTCQCVTKSARWKRKGKHALNWKPRLTSPKCLFVFELSCRRLSFWDCFPFLSVCFKCAEEPRFTPRAVKYTKQSRHSGLRVETMCIFKVNTMAFSEPACYTLSEWIMSICVVYSNICVLFLYSIFILQASSTGLVFILFLYTTLIVEIVSHSLQH